MLLRRWPRSRRAITNAERPVIFAGSGVRLSGAIPEFEQIIRIKAFRLNRLGLMIFIASDDELFCGRPGTIGERAGNFYGAKL